MAMTFVHGYSNLGQRTTIAGKGWPARAPIVLKLLATVIRASVYSFAECDHDQALQICAHLGWGTAGRPSHRTDENRNSVLWDPRRWRDIESHAYSLSTVADDLADRQFRSVQWVRLAHRRMPLELWIGAGHLSNAAPAERPAQARVLAATAPPGPLPALLGIDRNAFPTSSPSTIIAEALPLLSTAVGDSFTGDGIQQGRPAIDGIHGRGLAADVTQFSPLGGTDHSFFRSKVTITERQAIS